MKTYLTIAFVLLFILANNAIAKSSKPKSTKSIASHALAVERSIIRRENAIAKKAASAAKKAGKASISQEIKVLQDEKKEV